MKKEWLNEVKERERERVKEKEKGWSDEYKKKDLQRWKKIVRPPPALYLYASLYSAWIISTVFWEKGAKIVYIQNIRPLFDKEYEKLWKESFNINLQKGASTCICRIQTQLSLFLLF